MGLSGRNPRIAGMSADAATWLEIPRAEDLLDQEGGVGLRFAQASRRVFTGLDRRRLHVTLKSIIKSMPVIGPLAVRLRQGGRSDEFRHSAEYWDKRYKVGGTSGAGSYNRLAEFKAEFLNDFVKQHQVTSVIEFGSGDGAQLKLADYPKYIGVDVSQTAVSMTRKMFKDFPAYKFYQSAELPAGTTADLSLSLDVIYHLVEDVTFESYMSSLFDAAERMVIIYASNEDKAWSSPHVRHRRFQTWVETKRPDFVLTSHTPNRYPYDEADVDNTSFADFYVFRRA